MVDDDEFQRNLTARILEAEGYQLDLAASGSEAMTVLSGKQPDIILLDFLMPDMNGMEIISHIKADPRFAVIPVIMITGNSERDIVIKSVQLGAVDFVVKPFDRHTLLAKVDRALGAEAAALARRHLA